MKNIKFKEIMKNKKVKTGAMIALMVAPSLVFAGADTNAEGDAKDKINTIGRTVLNILISVVGIYLTIQLIIRALKIMQGEMSARELVPPIAGGVVAFLAYYLAKVVLNNMFSINDVKF